MNNSTWNTPNGAPMSWAAWIWSIAIAVIFSAIIAAFYLRNLEPSESLPYLAALGLIAGISIWLTKYCDQATDRYRGAAFICKLALWIIMGANAVATFYVGRGMSIARDETARLDGIQQQQVDLQKQQIETVKQLGANAGRQGTLELARQMNSIEGQRKAQAEAGASRRIGSAASVFKSYETLLLVIMIIETLAALTCAAVMIGLHTFTDEGQRRAAGRQVGLAPPAGATARTRGYHPNE